jgi:1-acyl-sn-glycerol-3-phosphate acyltransferase
MLDFCDEPYCFFEAKPNRLIMAISRTVNRLYSLGNPNHRVRDLQLTGEVDRLRELAAASGGARLLFVANHSTHSDPQVMTEVQRQVGAKTHFMAAYDVFLRSKLMSWVLQRNGAFSVDREGSDSRSMKTALSVLADPPFGMGLTIFPEGNVYLTNDRVTPFLDGAAFIALKAQKQIGGDKPIHVVPLAFKFTHLDNVRDGICARLKQLATEVDSSFDRDSDPVDEILRIGQLLLKQNLRKRGRLADDGKSLTDQLTHSAEEILDGLEKNLELRAKPSDGPVERVRKVRARLHQLRTDTEKGQAFSDAHIEAWADEAILAFRILVYCQPYVAEKPTVDRFAEATERLMEDHFSKALPPLGDRRVMVNVGEAIDLSERLEAFSAKARNAVNALTLDMESSVQNGLDTANASNSAAGGELFGSGCEE